MNDQIVRLPEVIKRTGLSAATLTRYEKSGAFPKRRKLGGRAIGWLSSEIDSWVSAQGVIETRGSRGKDQTR